MRCARRSPRARLAHPVFVAARVAAALLLAGCAGLSSGRPGSTVAIEGDRWLLDGRPVNAGSPAEGRLMNVRMVNAVFEDEGQAADSLPAGFDPEENTTAFIRRMPEYVATGVDAFTVSLQGGMPGYEGALNSAYEADGSLRPAYMARVARVIEAADRLGAVVVLSCLYQRQHSHPRALAGREAVRRAVAGAAEWVRSRRYSNVVLEVANEFPHGGYRSWRDGEWLRSPEGQVELIELVHRTAPGLLVSTSGMGDATVAPAVAEAADFVLLHFNGTPLEGIGTAVAAARAYDKPVVVNEDAKVGEEGASAAALAVRHGAGWGFMHLEKNQTAPFEFEGPADDPLVYAAFRTLTSPTPPAASAPSF